MTLEDKCGFGAPSISVVLDNCSLGGGLCFGGGREGDENTSDGVSVRPSDFRCRRWAVYVYRGAANDGGEDLI